MPPARTTIDQSASLPVDALTDGPLKNANTATPVLAGPGKSPATPDLHDSGIASYDANIPGGMIFNYLGSIVPENPGQGQITEAAFWNGVADQLARQLPSTPGMGEAYDAQVYLMRGLIDRFVVPLIPPGVRWERVLRLAFGLSDDLKDYVPPEQFISTMAEVLDIASPASDLRLMARLADNAQRLEQAGSEESQEAAAAELFMEAGVFWFPPGKPDGEAKKVTRRRFYQLLGNKVHAIIQAHYWLTHPNDVILFEDFVVAGPELLSRIYTKDFTWAPPYDFMPKLRAALVSETVKPGDGVTKGVSKRPDIFNISLEHLYEIKPATKVKEGLGDLDRYRLRLQPFFPKLHLAGLAPDDWRPLYIYAVGGRMIITTEVMRPGLIVYQPWDTPDDVFVPFAHWVAKRQQEGHRRVMHDPIPVRQPQVAGGHGVLLIVGVAAVLLLAAILIPGLGAVAAGAAVTAGTGGSTLGLGALGGAAVAGGFAAAF